MADFTICPSYYKPAGKSEKMSLFISPTPKAPSSKWVQSFDVFICFLSCIQNLKFSLMVRFTDTGATLGHVLHVHSRRSHQLRELLTKQRAPVLRLQINQSTVKNVLYS